MSKKKNKKIKPDYKVIEMEKYYYFIPKKGGCYALDKDMFNKLFGIKEEG